ncbi:hypothetical protein [Streptomyces pseudogriseolus]|uniref:hypothetical protein n=1 Tax=Streptomyces pseudogriseolus TaxID=36817 RepID=UPI00117F4903
MTSTARRMVPGSVDLAARVTALLGKTYPAVSYGAVDGFRVMSLDQQEPRRMFVRWYDDRERALTGAPVAEEKSKELASVLAAAGFAVTVPSDGWDVYVADRPADTAGPRYRVAESDLPFGDLWLVVDEWTRVPARTVRSKEEAETAAETLNLPDRLSAG